MVMIHPDISSNSSKAGMAVISLLLSSTGNDEEVGKMIAEAMEKVGKEGLQKNMTK